MFCRRTQQTTRPSSVMIYSLCLVFAFHSPEGAQHQHNNTVQVRQVAPPFLEMPLQICSAFKYSVDLWCSIQTQYNPRQGLRLLTSKIRTGDSENSPTKESSSTNCPPIFSPLSLGPLNYPVAPKKMRPYYLAAHRLLPHRLREQRSAVLRQ